MITLTLKDQPHVPLEAECIAPDVFAPLAPNAIRGDQRQAVLAHLGIVSGATLRPALCTGRICQERVKSR